MKRRSKQNEHLVPWLLGPVLLGVGTVILWLFFLWPMQRIDATKTWAEIPCRITRCELRGEHSTASLDLRFDYEYKGQSYEGEHYDVYELIGLQNGDDTWARDAFRELAVDQVRVCYVDPSEPSEAILSRNARMATLSWIPGTLFIMLGAGFIVVPWWLRHRKSDRPSHLPGCLMIGAAFWTLGVLLFYLMDGPTHIRDLFRGTTNWTETTGTIEWRRPSGIRVFGGTVYEYQIHYSVDDESHSPRCYSIAPRSTRDDQVAVEYDPNEPSRGRLVGTRTTATPIYFLPIPLGLIALLGFCGCVALVRLVRDLAR